MHRSTYFAGQWYPADASNCLAAIKSHAADTTPEQGPWCAIIAPHAGWSYSGDAAAHVYRWVAEDSSNIDLVVVFGAHRGSTGPSTIFLDDGWETPFGILENAQGLARQLAKDLDLQEEPASPMNPDNAAELQMPFVRHFFPDSKLLMLGVEASTRACDIGEAVAKAISNANRRAVFVGSTDLTHYGPNYGFEPQGYGKKAVEWVRNINDQGFIDFVLALDANGAINHAKNNHSACGAGAVAACITAAKLFGSQKGKLVDHYLSHDVHPGSNFVGYAGIVF